MKAYTKSERLERMHDISTSIDVIQDNINALDSFYFEEASIGISIQTDDYKEKGNDSRIVCNKTLLADYLQRERDRLHDELLDHMDALQNEIYPTS